MCGPDLSPASQDKSLPQKALTKRLAVATAFALGHVLASAGIRPDMFLGHGTGELAASALAGKSSLEEVLALVDTPEAHPSYAGSKQCGTDSQECCSPWGRHSTLVEAADSTLQQKITLCRDRGATIFMTLWPSQTDKDIRNVFENSNIPFSWIYLLPSPDVLSQLTPVQIRAAFAEGIGKLFKNGCNITPDRNTPLMQIPSYPFARDIHWISNGRSVSDALRTPKGKTCSLPPNAMVPNHAPQAAESSVEEGLQTIWNEALGISDIELDDDFFMRGGTSLSAISIIAALEQHTGLSIPLPEFLDLRTIRRVLDHLALLAEKAEVTAGVH